MKCPSCQAENRDAARFCLACGKSLAPMVAIEASATLGATAQPLTSEVLPALLDALANIPTLPDAELNARIEEAQPLSSVPDGPPAAGDVERTGAAMPGAAPDVATDATLHEAELSEPEFVEPAVSIPVSIPAGDEMTEAGSSPMATPSEAPGPPPVVSGTKIAGRFEIRTLLETRAGVNLYDAADITACPVCGVIGNGPDDAYCVDCGVELRNAGGPVMLKLREAFSPDALGVQIGDGFIEGGRFYLRVSDEVLPASMSAGSAEAVTTSGTRVLTAGYASHVGMERALDEDSLCVFTLAGVYESVADPTSGLFIVADGMGGHDGGEVASKLTVQKIAEQLIKRVLLPRFAGKFQGQAGAVQAHLRKAIIDANKEVYDLAQKRAIDMGCTLTMAMIVDGMAHIANVGDSRTYIHRQGHLHQITADHSLVASLVTAGVIQSEEIYTHPERNVIYRSIGTTKAVEVDIFQEPLAAGDTLLVCCDGLWEAIRDEGIEDVLLAYPDPQAACVELVRQANLAGGEDNISVIVVKVHEVPAEAFVP
jgi:serine/threonine protein phosphatase PrpC